MQKKEMNGKDLLLCFLYSPGITDMANEPIIGRTKLTKMMYLFEKQIYNDFFKDYIEISLPLFEPYYFGPFSRQLFEDLSFFQSIGFISAEETNIPLSNADQVEYENVFDSIDEEDNTEDYHDSFELSYKLSSNGMKYVQEQLWNRFTTVQKEKLKMFKKQINLISLDALLRYIYNTYPDDARKSLIANRYIQKEDV